MHIAVQTPEVGEVAVEWRNIGVVRVVDLHRNDVFTANHQRAAGFKAKRRKASLVLSQVGPVGIHIRHQAGSIKLQKELMARVVGGNRVMEPIPTHAAIIAATVLPIDVVPCMRQCHRSPTGIIECCSLSVARVTLKKFPTGVDNGIDTVGRWRSIRSGHLCLGALRGECFERAATGNGCCKRREFQKSTTTDVLFHAVLPSLQKKLMTFFLALLAFA